MEKKKLILYALAAVFVILQFIQPKRENPPVKAEVNVDEKLKNIFKKSCYDCHSNETTWPWYAYVSPVNYLISYDVEDGRRHLNFSDWENYETRRKIRKLNEIKEELEADAMPITSYVLLHPSTSLEISEKELILSWVKAELDTLETYN